MESLTRWREPAAFVAVGALSANLVYSLIVVFAGPAPLAEAASGWSTRVASPLLLVVLALLVIACRRGVPSPNARLVGAFAAVVGSLSVLAGLVLALIGLGSGSPTPLLDGLGNLLSLAVPAIAVGALVALFIARPASVPDVAAAPPASASPPPAALPAPAPPPPDPHLQPTWPTDTASGAAWRTAGDAAAGAPATRWGSGTDTPGWRADATGDEAGMRTVLSGPAALPPANPGPPPPPASSLPAPAGGTAPDRPADQPATGQPPAGAPGSWWSQL